MIGHLKNECYNLSYKNQSYIQNNFKNFKYILKLKEIFGINWFIKIKDTTYEYNIKFGIDIRSIVSKKCYESRYVIDIFETLPILIVNQANSCHVPDWLLYFQKEAEEEKKKDLAELDEWIINTYKHK